MTAKRFEVVMNEFDEVEYIMDKAMMEDRDFAEFMDFVEDVCKENEQLKFERDRYKRLSEIRHELINNRILTIKEFIDNCSDKEVKKTLEQLFHSEVNEYDLSKKIRKLGKENEQLKTTIQQLRTDNTKQKKKLNTIMKENEQLKCGNKNLKSILNDFINILNRLQSNPNDKQTLNVARDMLQNMGKELEE